MNMVRLIEKKRRGGALTDGELGDIVRGYTRGDIPDYQMSAFLMAVCLRGMSAEETVSLTLHMLHSGETLDLSAIAGIKTDKHSTGGIGDKTTLVLVPLVAACGGRAAKLSGRGLGFTGGTIDKLEAIPGFQTSLPLSRFVEQVNRIGAAIAGQMGNLVPADKRIYALRDVTGTVESLPLIASSIMSKKLASGADAVVLDVKAGSGAFMKTRREAEALAALMVRIGRDCGKCMDAVITEMDQPLGSAVGNALEVQEALELLRGGGPADLRELCLDLAARMLVLSELGDYAACRGLAARTLDSGGALERFRMLIEAQGGDGETAENPARLPAARYRVTIPAKAPGKLTGMDGAEIGRAAVLLGAGRLRLEERVDPAAGIRVLAKPGDVLECGTPLAELCTNREENLRMAERVYRGALRIEE